MRIIKLCSSVLMAGYFVSGGGPDTPRPEASAHMSPRPMARPELRLVEADALNPRRGPALSFKVLETVGKGALTRVLLDTGHGWARVRLASGQEGWMAVEHLAALHLD